MITIAITKELHSKLKGIKVHERESFNDVVERLYNEEVMNDE